MSESENMNAEIQQNVSNVDRAVSPQTAISGVQTESSISQRILSAKLPRRGILGLGALALGAIGIRQALGTGEASTKTSPNTEASENSPETTPLAELPEGVLTSEELAANNIRIFNVPGTELFVKNSALELPLFKDASEGLTGDAVIVLMDTNRINWAESEKLPDEPKTILQSVIHNPYNRPKHIQDAVIEGLDIRKDTNRQLREIAQRDVIEIPSGKAQRDTEMKIKNLEAEIAAGSNKTGLEHDLDVQQRRLKAIIDGTAYESAVNRIKFTEESDHKLDKEKEVLMSPEAARLEDLASNGGTGAFVRLNGMPFQELKKYVDDSYDWNATISRYEAALKKHPEWANNNYLFVAVGGDLKVTPDQKPDPSMFREKESIKEFADDDLRRETRYRYNRPPYATITLEHEVGHYGRDAINGEYTADTFSHDVSDETHFIFRTPEGLTYASTHNSPSNTLQTA